MATVSWNGAKFYAAPVQELPNGDWLMKMQQHGPRFSIGTTVRIKASEIIELASAEMPPTDGAAELQAAMDARPANMLTPAQIIANWHAGTLNTAPAQPNTPAAPTVAVAASALSGASLPSPALQPAQQPQDPAMSSKLAALPGLAQDFAASVNSLADTTAARLQKAKAGAGAVVDKLNAVSAEVEASTSAIEDVINQMTNGAPAGK